MIKPKKARSLSPEEYKAVQVDNTELHDAIKHKRPSSVKLSSITTQRFMDDIIGRIGLCFVISIILLLAKFIQPNLVNTYAVIFGFIGSLVILFFITLKLIAYSDKKAKNKSIKLPFIYTLLMFVPFLFGLYLIIWVGFINLFVSFGNQFSIFFLFQAIIYIAIGISIIKNIKEAQEYAIRLGAQE